MKILVVDDSSTMRRIIQNTLARLGYKNVIQAADGIEAWQVMQENQDRGVVITDWNMPNMNGLELVKKIRSVNKNIPIIMVTTDTPQVLKEKLEAVLGKNEG
jgi:two-component system chemotaxis response regulator CheY